MHRFLIAIYLFINPVLADEIFEEKQLGYKFEVGKNVLYAHNPHSMRKTKIYYGDVHVGGFTISLLPDGYTTSEFIASGKPYYHSKYPDSKVSIKEKRNAKGLGYSEVLISHESQNTTEKKVVFFKDRDGAPRQGVLTMMYTFHLFYPTDSTKEKVNAINLMVNSLELPENDGIYNYSIKRVVEQEYPNK